MRLVAAGVLVASACVAVLGVALAQKASSRAPLNEPSTAKAAPEAVVAAAPQSTAPAPVVRLAQAQPAAAPPPAPPPAHVAAATPQASAPSAQAVASCPGHPDALGVARVVEIDTTGGPGFGFEHFKAYDFLRPGEVVLTFDDGPWPNNTPAVLQALADHCTKATFFPIGKHAMWHPEILKQVAAAGHTIGSHTWSHADLSKKTEDEAKEEIERGISAVREALGAPESPFFRFPALRHPPAMLSYLEQRNIGIFSTDFDSFDFKIHKPDQLIRSVMTKLKKQAVASGPMPPSIPIVFLISSSRR